MISALDSHIHIWDRTRGETFIAEKAFPVLTGKAFLPQDVPAMLAETGAKQAVLVHGPSSVTHAEHCLEMANAHDVFLSVIGWVDIRGTRWSFDLDKFSDDPLFRGIRLTPALDPEPADFLKSDDVAMAAKAIGSRAQILEVLAVPNLMPMVASIAASAPDAIVSLAHFGLPDGTEVNLNTWREQLALVAAYTNTIVKVSGLPLTGEDARDSVMVRNHLEVLLDLFGPERMCYSSNWPVATALASPLYWRTMLDKEMQRLGLSVSEKTQILKDTAMEHYAVR